MRDRVYVRARDDLDHIDLSRERRRGRSLEGERESERE